VCENLESCQGEVVTDYFTEYVVVGSILRHLLRVPVSVPQSFKGLHPFYYRGGTIFIPFFIHVLSTPYWGTGICYMYHCLFTEENCLFCFYRGAMSADFLLSNYRAIFTQSREIFFFPCSKQFSDNQRKMNFENYI